MAAHGLVDGLTAGLEVSRSTWVPQPRLGDGVQVLADSDVALANALTNVSSVVFVTGS